MPIEKVEISQESRRNATFSYRSDNEFNLIPIIVFH